jgi:hypothetical protein
MHLIVSIPGAFVLYLKLILSRRNTSATDDDKFPYNTKSFKDLDSKKYMFFRTPEDLMNIDILGNCNNASVPQNLTFGYQDELLGIHGSASGLSIGYMLAMMGAIATSLFIMA